MEKRPSKLVLSLGIIAVLAACLVRFFWPGGLGRTSIITSSMLSEAVNISELSTAEFRYRGIADVYEDESRAKVRCKVCYSAVVKAGIDMKDVKFSVDPVQKTVTASLPEITLKVNIVDEEAMAVLPSNADAGITSLLKYSREDAEREAGESRELMAAARENLVSAIEGLLYPILRPQGYTLAFS